MIRLAKPEFSDETIRSVLSVIKSGDLVMGEYVSKVEQFLESYLNVENAVLVSSGTAALHLSLLSLGIGAGDEVIVPAFTFPATANMVEAVGAKPVFVDIALDDFCIDCEKIEASISSKTKAIIPVHAFGQPANMEAVLDIAKCHGLFVIEDAACALGAEFENVKVGAYGDLGCFSFHPRKAITTGEGGGVVTNDDKLAQRLRVLRNHGMDLVGNSVDFVAAGYNYRMTDIQAALGYESFLRIELDIKYRLNLASCYENLLAPIAAIKRPVFFSNRRMVYQAYHVLVDRELGRDRLREALFENGVESNIGAQALGCLSYYKDKYGLDSEAYPNANVSYKDGLALPIGCHIDESDIKTIAEIIKNEAI